MNAVAKAKLVKALSFITGAAALCVGLGAMQIDVMDILHLKSFDIVLRYLVGIAGLASIVMFFCGCSSSKC